MSSPPQLAYETIYHIWNRGVNRQNIFVVDDNYRHFLKMYAQHILPVASTFAYCLLPNHFHLGIRTLAAEQIEKNYAALQKPQPLTPSQAFSNFFNSYVKAFNKWNQRTGGLFEGRFGRKPVKTHRQLVTLITYIHRNPETHGLIDDFREWRYSSYGALVGEKATRLNRDDALALYGNRMEFIEAHAQPVNEKEIETLIENDFV